VLSPSPSASVHPPLLLITLRFHHSPGWLTQTKAKAMAHDLPVREHFGEYVSHHIVSWAVYHVDCPTRNDLSNKVEAYVDVLRV